MGTKIHKVMTEPYTIQINGVSCLITASCLAEAKQKAKKMNGQIVGTFDVCDYEVIKLINENLKR